MHARIQVRDETRKVLELTATNYACSMDIDGSVMEATARTASVKPSLATVAALVAAPSRPSSMLTRLCVSAGAIHTREATILFSLA